MPVSESLCWEVLKSVHGQRVASAWLRGREAGEPPFENASPQSAIEADLVIRHPKAAIEDSLYFLEKRGYLVRHGYQGLTRVVLQLSPLALAVLESGRFSGEEQQAFRDAVFRIETTDVYGAKFNLPELYRRIRKWFVGQGAA